MKTAEKIKKVRDFLKSPQNKLIWSNKDETLQAGKFFDIELSMTFKEIDFSICVESDNIDEAISILKNVTINKDSTEIRTEVENKLLVSLINPNDKFYIIVKGNKNEKYQDTEI